MEKEKVRNKNGKVFGLNKVELIKKKYLSLDYKVELYSYNKITDTGHLVIGRLISLKDILPSFTFRWDNKKETLDVDPDNMENDMLRNFKKGNNGYRGHHTTRISSKKDRIFRVDVTSFDERIFCGEVKVSVFRELEL